MYAMEVEVGFAHRPTVAGTPEGRLWCAMLHSAITDASSMTEASADSSNALRWLRSVDKSPGSARWVCDVLDIDYDKVLAIVVHMKANRSREDRLKDMLDPLPSKFSFDELVQLIPQYKTEWVRNLVNSSLRLKLIKRTFTGKRRGLDILEKIYEPAVCY